MLKKEKREKRILLLSFFAGLLFAVVELIFAIFSHSHSVLMDAVYDSSELIFIALILFLTPLFYKPVSEQHPYGFFQVESIFLIIKAVMMISVSLGVAIEVVQSALSGGNLVNGLQISIFQLALGFCCMIVFLIMRKMNHSIYSPMVQSELLEWKIDIGYSLGMALAFFASDFLDRTSLAFLKPYVDPAVAVIVMLLTLPECIKMLWRAMRDVFLFPPDEETVDGIKGICAETLTDTNLEPVFYDIIRTGRHIWVTVYFETENNTLRVRELKRITEELNEAVKKQFANCTCELMLNS